MKIVLRVLGPLFIAVGLFWFARGTGLFQGPHNAAMIDYGAGAVALALQLPTCFEMRTLSGGLVSSAP